MERYKCQLSPKLTREYNKILKRIPTGILDKTILELVKRVSAYEFPKITD